MKNMSDKTKCYICLGIIGLLIIRNISLMNQVKELKEQNK